MELKNQNGYLVFEKDNESFYVEKTIDEDIWFSTKNPCFTMSLDIYSRDINERIAANEFFKLMQLIVGNYILEGHSSNEMLPKDFIDIENKIITWHSDNENDNVLELSFEERFITIAMTKENKSQYNRIRIRTNGSDYGIYHIFFTDFYGSIIQIINDINHKEAIENQPKQKSKKKISFKNILNRK